MVSQYGRSNPSELRLSEARHLRSIVGVVTFTLASDRYFRNKTKVGKLQHPLLEANPIRRRVIPVIVTVDVEIYKSFDLQVLDKSSGSLNGILLLASIE
ncbi:hypothetical protein FocTR4_00004907 [Fusarium oxysporum f. sp. cubense]|uniref:Uncharacterized protein n=1 Tax=Fusarium oxysporum f. sp. cubense TaxID=61366 RepID=A0A5C6TKK4_FUSOC|nr:hypothetical protein FocTR4_00004907 [Fusarium oxysporum f. sp. cubense]